LSKKWTPLSSPSPTSLRLFVELLRERPCCHKLYFMRILSLRLPAQLVAEIESE
jgi:hypothetical protein